ncbi:larval cuticle protein A2B [Lucilia sericata]|uniref:larval cuticle protein A2B n=1 Tax=Lucilia sericata TaxID=13632 RepID=UPI0018A84F11|nr:larval cuticle protein A2B [Lucilia sericata]
MALKIVICLMAIAHIAIGVEVKDEPDYGPVAYEFHYSVHDPHTGDIKSHKETRKDDKVEGSYELIDSDGYRRLVKYKADDHIGFEAIVLREPTDIKIPIPEPKKVEAAPVVHYASKPALKAVHAPDYGTFVSYTGSSHNYKY